MVFFIGRETSKSEELSRILAAGAIHFRHIEWTELNPKDTGVYVITSLPEEPPARDRLKRLAQNRQIVILWGDESLREKEQSEPALGGIRADSNHSLVSSFLKLPVDTPVPVVLSLIDWFLVNTGHNQLLTELSLASDLQRSLIPKQFPRDLPVNFVHKYLPHTFIGGDLFDVIRLGKNKLGVIITDVSGHGISAAFITAMFKTAFTHYAKESLSPARVLHNLNKEFFTTLHTGHYLTAFYAVFDLKAMSCTYCNAGHPRQLLFKNNGEIVELDTLGFFIGSFENSSYEEAEITFSPGDRFYFYTDGIIEVRNAKGHQFGRDNLKKIIRENSHLDLASISNMIISILMMYMNEPSFPDDLTLVIMEMMESI